MSAYYRSTVRTFLAQTPEQIIGELTRRAGESYSSLLASTVVSWERTIVTLKREFAILTAVDGARLEWGLLLEYEIPRRTQRIDAVVLSGDIIVVLEFKTGAAGDAPAARRQVEHYALDLRDFHRQSRGRTVVPVVVMSSGNAFRGLEEAADAELVKGVSTANDETLHLALQQAVARYGSGRPADQIDVDAWDGS